MFLDMETEQIIQLEKENFAECFARFSDLAKARSYYTNQKGLYSAYVEKIENLKFGFATPVKVYKIKKLPR